MPSRQLSARLTDEAVLEVYNAHARNGDIVGCRTIAKEIGKSKNTVLDSLRRLRSAGEIPQREQAVHLSDDTQAHIFPEDLKPDDVGFDTLPTLDRSTREQELESEIEELRQMLSWQASTSVGEIHDGTMTLALSDLHIFDRGHMITSYLSLEEKLIELIHRFQPRRFRGVLNGDVIPGAGIYRNQAMDNVMSRTDQQVAGGAYRFFETHERIAKRFPDMEIEWVVTEGNHDYNRGEPTSFPFTWAIRALGVPAKYVGTEWILDVSDAGTYNVLFEHGYGGSTYHQSSNKMIFETLRKIIGYQNRGYAGQERLRRVCHGHLHFLTIGVERAEGVEFDTTGGLQRNDRANIGANTRPCGWIAYISPANSSQILTPIALKPHEAAIRDDMDDPELAERNRQEAARCLTAFYETARALGISADMKVEAAKKG